MDDSASSCSTPAVHGSGTFIDLHSSSPLRTASNSKCTRTAHEIAFPDISFQMPPYDRDTEHAWLVVGFCVQYLEASNMHVFKCIYCEDLR